MKVSILNFDPTYLGYIRIFSILKGWQDITAVCVQLADIFFILAMWPYLVRRPLKYSSNGVTGVIIFTVANTVSKMF